MIVPWSLSGFEKQFRSSVLLIVLYATVASLALIPTNIIESDLGWHLRTGQWIAENGWVPSVDWFSTYGIGKPWAAYSWLFEILIYGLERWLGLLGVLVVIYVMMLGIAASIHSLVSKFEARAVYSAALTIVAIFAIAGLRSPRPWLFTILLFTIELNILVHVRQSRNYRVLIWLPPLFALWANLHIQFIYGLFVLGLATIEWYLLPASMRRDPSVNALPVRRMVVVTVASLLATLINPYHVRIYAVVLDTIRQGGLYELISELQALPFRTLADWMVLALTIAASFVFGRSRARSPFWAALFLTGAFLSFRSMRDVWFITIVASAMVAGAGLDLRPLAREPMSRGQALLIVLASVVILIITVRGYQLSNMRLQQVMSQTYPVAAAAFIDEQGLRGQLYNHFDWGGYLSWRLQTSTVSIDSRSNLHRSDRIDQSAKVWRGEPGWATDPELSTANVVVAEREFALTQLLRLDPRFRLVYEDDIAAVFVRQPFAGQ